MQKNIAPLSIILSFLLFFLSALPLTASGDELSTGGIRFTGEREGVCVLIEGEYIEESIYFKLDTCDQNKEVEEQFKSSVSIMPNGLLDRLTEEEILQLVAYIVARGRSDASVYTAL